MWAGLAPSRGSEEESGPCLSPASPCQCVTPIFASVLASLLLPCHRPFSSKDALDVEPTLIYNRSPNLLGLRRGEWNLFALQTLYAAISSLVFMLLCCSHFTLSECCPFSFITLSFAILLVTSCSSSGISAFLPIETPFTVVSSTLTAIVYLTTRPTASFPFISQPEVHSSQW